MIYYSFVCSISILSNLVAHVAMLSFYIYSTVRHDSRNCYQILFCCIHGFQNDEITGVHTCGNEIYKLVHMYSTWCTHIRIISPIILHPPIRADGFDLTFSLFFSLFFLSLSFTLIHSLSLLSLSLRLYLTNITILCVTKSIYNIHIISCVYYSLAI